MKEFIRKEKLMGTAFSLGVVAHNEEEANYWLDIGIQEISRIEDMLSEYKHNSVTSKINRNAGSGTLKINKEVLDLIERSNAISKLTEGDFDITVGPLKSLYSFKNTTFKMPSKAKIDEVLKEVGYHNILIDKQASTIEFHSPKTQISFNAIGKGYASDMVKKLWLRNGVTSGFINASGDLNAFGEKAKGEYWRVGISNPDNREEALLYVPLNNASIATSGDYEQHFIWQNKRFSHNINPHTGIPLCGIKSVTVVSPSAELSDALATAVYVKGVEKGLDFVNQLPHTHCIIIDDRNKLFFSKKLNYEKVIN